MATLTDAEIQDRLANVDGWQRGDDHSIVRELKFGDFAEAIEFVKRVADLAEEENHHPDILIYGWNKVRLTLSTHSQGGLTDADFRLASRIEGLL
jgi:4a-hydroxytetrahydrobiopterin dehydratase